MYRTELKVEYNAEMKPTSASCTACGEKMPKSPADLENPADIIVWLSGKYIEHKRAKHSQDERRRVPRD
jgi:hypothetical protein